MFNHDSQSFQIFDVFGKVIKISKPSNISSTYIEINGVFFSKKTGYKLSKKPNYYSSFQYDDYSNSVKIFDFASHIENFDENNLQSLNFSNQNISFDEIFDGRKDLTIDNFLFSIKEILPLYNIPDYATIEISSDSICFSFTRKETYDEYYKRVFFDVRTKLIDLEIEKYKLSSIIENSKNDLKKIENSIKIIKG